MNSQTLYAILGVLGALMFLLAWFFLLIEAYGLIILKNIYSRMLLTSLADTVAILLLFTAILMSHLTLSGSGKMLVLMVFLMVINPVTSHLIARSARRNGIGLTDRREDD